ncbi:hypothetical protein NSK11_contig00022-0041 [Nocardia seriolae]|uniref:DUF6817 domain-containing protein n=1 Tax=Nocardia seriolae TaxID=37332 RepID=A0ABC9YQJ3_9NOCA|nr:hypothetical protein NSER024013_23560 [Nocardia seriolae]GAM45673.1 hypothetical protein NS07_v2contig00018-0041 [Nocardia seriolae]GAP27697.1 hypothetical protein NSK11_contig00022-0041 [Nocardia seriolae]GEM23346.1 hypothetical protein NS2_15850 [Nocardia seriolae NBRC 15557]
MRRDTENVNDPDPFASRRIRVERFLRDRGADTIDHPGGTLLAHLGRVADTLAAWGHDADLQLAGLAHAVYGTDGFDRHLVESPDRSTVVDLVGDRAEALIYLYACCDRSALYPRIDATTARFRDRFTAREFEPAPTDFAAFLELTVANELDVMAQNADLATQHGAGLYDLFARARPHLTPAAWSACHAQLARYHRGP